MLDSGRVWAPLLSVWALFGCHDSLSSSQTAGELGNGTFRYLCVREGDALCARGGEASTFPERIATTGFFDVQFEANSSHDRSAYDVSPAAGGIIDEQNDIFQAKAQGLVALLAKRTADSRVIDFVHVNVVDVAKIRFSTNGSPASVLWQTGKTQSLLAMPVDSVGLTLAGALDYEWSVDDPALVRTTLTNPAAEMHFLPLAPGTATISVTSGSHTETLTVTIQGQPVHRDGGAPPPDAGTPAEAGSPGDASSDAAQVVPGEGGSPTPDAAVRIPDGGQHD